MRRSLACAALALVSAVLYAQSAPPDLSGRWRLVEPAPTERAADTLAIVSPDELLITQTPLAIIVEHPSKPGTHPAAGRFEYGVVGTASGTINVAPTGSTSTTTHIGTKLMIAHSTTTLADERGVRTTVAHGSMWQIDRSDRLAIEFEEQRTGQPTKVAVRVYVKVASQ